MAPSGLDVKRNIVRLAQLKGMNSRYYQFMKTIREKKVDFGYIHGVNIEKNIRDIYREVVVSE